MTMIGEAWHPHATIDRASCTIGHDCYIWQYASVIRRARLGAGCTIAANAIIDGAWLGDGCLVGHAASLHPGTRLGDRVFVGPGAIFCNDLWPKVSKQGFDFAGLATRSTVLVDDGASICAGAIILPGVKIGADAVVAAGVVCGVDVPAGQVLRRDGTLEPVPADMNLRRMRWAV